MNQKIETNTSLMARGAVLIFIFVIFSRFFSYLFTLIVARVGVREFGALSLGFSLLEFLFIISLLGIDAGVERFIALALGKQEQENTNGYFFSSFAFVSLLSAGLGALLFYFAPSLAQLFNEPLLTNILRVFGVALPFFSLINVLRRTLSAFKKAHIASFFADTLFNLLKLAFVIPAILFFKGDAFSAAICYLIANIVIYFILYFGTVSLLKFKPRFKLRLLKPILLFSIPLAIAGVLSVVIGKTDVLMIGYFLSSSHAGLYSVALLTGGLLMICSSAIISMSFPFFMQRFSQKQEIQRIYYCTSKWTFMSTLPLFLIITIYSSKIISFFFGAEYAIVGVEFILLAAGYLIFSMTVPNLNILKMVGNSKQILIVSVIAAVGNILLNAVLIPLIGMIGGAISTLITYILLSIGYSFCAKRIAKIRMLGLKYVWIVFSALISTAIISICEHAAPISTIFELFFMAAGFCVIYIVCLFITNSFDNEDINALKSMIPFLGSKHNYLKK